MRSKFRIFTSILFCFGSLLAISLALIIAINFSNSVQIFSKLLRETLVRGVGGLELALRTHLDAAEEQANFIVAHILSKDRAISELEGFADFASGSFAAAPQITGVLITDADGHFLGVRRTRWGGVEHEWSPTPKDAASRSNSARRSIAEESEAECSKDSAARCSGVRGASGAPV